MNSWSDNNNINKKRETKIPVMRNVSAKEYLILLCGGIVLTLAILALVCGILHR